MKKLIAILILVLFLSGCAQPPEQIKVDGVDKAKNSADVQIASLGESASVSEILSTLPAHVDQTLTGKNSELAISATVVVPPVDTIYSATLSPKIPDSDTILSACFGDQAKNAVKKTSEDTSKNEYNMYKDNSNSVVEAFLAWSDDGSLFYVNLELNDKYPNQIEVASEDAPNCKLSRADAIKMAKDLLSKLGIEMDTIDINNVGSQVSDEGAGKGFYIISFTRQYFQIPFVDPSSLPTSMYIPSGTMAVCEEGIISAQGQIFMEAVNEAPIKSIVSIEDIISIIPGMMDTKINTKKDTPIDTISLNYVLKTDEKGLPRLTPVWVFDIDQKAARLVITDDKEYLARAAMDLFFSAETGQLEAVW